MSVFHNLQSTLERNNAPILSFLNPGLTRNEIKTCLVRFKFPIPEEFLSLYEWHNGARFSESHLLKEQWLLGPYLFPSLDRVKELYNETATDKYIKLSHLPILEDNGGPMLLIECNKKSKQFGMILEYDINAVDYDTTITKYDSITTLFQTIIEIYSNNTSDEINKIANELNPKSKYWKIFD